MHALPDLKAQLPISSYGRDCLCCSSSCMQQGAGQLIECAKCDHYRPQFPAPDIISACCKAYYQNLHTINQRTKAKVLCNMIAVDAGCP